MRESNQSKGWAGIMYKDVKKKLLAVALCICMVIGAVEVVPRVKADAQPMSDQTATIKGHLVGGSGDSYFTVTYRV